MKKNDRIRLTITDMGTNGEGIGKYDGFTFFVKNAVIGDKVLALVTKMKKGYGYAKVMEILQSSPDRVKPICPIAERCGGCQIMQLSYEAQLRFKENKVRNNLQRIGGISCEQMQPIIGMSDSVWEKKTADLEPQQNMPQQEKRAPQHFRNKMQFPVGWNKEGHVVTGFYAGRTHYIVETPNCPVAPKVDQIVLETVRGFIEKHRFSTYDEETGEGLIRHVLLRNGFYTGQIMVCLVINGDTLEGTYNENLFVETLLKLDLPDPWKISSICLNMNKEQTNVILGEEVRTLYGPDYIEDRIVSSLEGMEDLTFRINPLSFFQTNPQQTSRLYDAALQMAGLTGNEEVWDLYCGIGTISLFLAQKAKKVYGVEIVPEAIEDAKANAERNGIDNAEFLCGKSEEVFPAWVREHTTDEKTPDVVVLDPPRKGCDPELLKAICQVGSERIVYVSCDSATLARDLKYLCGGSEETGGEQKTKYALDKVQVVDMFPHTVHTESVCLLTRR